ncbi:MAG: hypothetical protein U1F27_01340 [Turneriella sp.]
MNSARILAALLLTTTLPSSCTFQNFGRFWEDKPQNVGSSAGSPSVSLPVNALWARSTTVATNGSDFQSVATDSSGNIIVAGNIQNTTPVNFGGTAITGLHSTNSVALVRYNAAGTLLSSSTATAASNQNSLNALAVDSSNNIYAVGYHFGTGSFNYGAGAVTGGNNANNAFITKYNSSGTALWTRSVTGGSSNSVFSSVAVDSAGNVYAVGYISATATYSFGAQTVTGVAGARNILIVKYNSAGTEQWVRTATSGTLASDLKAAAFDNASNTLIVGGTQNGPGTLAYGGTPVNAAYAGNNALVLKFDSLGSFVWGRSTAAAANNSRVDSLAVASTGDILACGYITGNTSYDFGSGVTVSAPVAALTNFVLLKVDSSGVPQWIRTPSVAADTSACNEVTVDTSGSVFTAGSINGVAPFTFGDKTVAGIFAGGSNSALVRYTLAGETAAINTVVSGASQASFASVAIDPTGNVFAVGTQNLNGSYGYGGGVNVAGASATANNAAIVKFQ